MSLVVVDPTKKIIAADTRVTYGNQFSDNATKLKQVGKVYVGAVGTLRVLDVCVQLIPSVFDDTGKGEITALANSLCEIFSNDLPGEVIVATPFGVWNIDSNGSTFEILEPMASGSGEEAAQVLLDIGQPLSEVFRVVSGRNASISRNFVSFEYA